MVEQFDLSSSSSSSSSTSSSGDSSSSEDCDDILYDKTYTPQDDSESDEDNINNLIPETDAPNQVATVTSESNSIHAEEATPPLNATGNSVNILITPEKKSLKRKSNENCWKRNILKKARNTGKAYETHTSSKKIKNERKMKPACGEKCKLKCSEKFAEEERLKIFSEYWALGDIQKQRQFISNSMQAVQPKYRYIRIGGTRSPRQNNNSFYFNMNNQRIRVCKLFFKNTLDINDRPIRTVLTKQNKVADTLLEDDLRGKHGKQKKVSEVVRNGIKQFIQNIPKIESHYTRANTSKLFIDGSKTISQLHADYVTECKTKNAPYGNYVLFYRVFTNDFNLSFFVPKKDLCETCSSYENSNDAEKEAMKEGYDQHLHEKTLSRIEKQRDKEDANAVVAVYDLQAVVQLPKGDVSVFYYKSKLNALNFTVYDLQSNKCDCFVWDESQGHRGVNELGTCVLKYLREINQNNSNANREVIFYSDNCAGQQKNKFMVALYLYAVRKFENIKSITHKYLIKGHTQNEGDSAHSLIERQMKRHLRGGPMYTPAAFISVIHLAKTKGEPFKVHEMNFEDFSDIKTLATDIGLGNMAGMKLSEVKILRVTKDDPNSVFFKTSYSDTDFQKVTAIKKKKKTDITLQPAFNVKPGISERKKDDLMDLVKKKHIPTNYKYFFESL